MLLSEAIRLGATLGRQVIGRFFSDEDGSCAIGAAFKAIGLDDELEELQQGEMPFDWRQYLAREWPWTVCAVACPGEYCLFHPRARDPVPDTITHLNDHHHWTREKIADWVETIEPGQLSPNHQQEIACQSEVTQPAELVYA